MNLYLDLDNKLEKELLEQLKNVLVKYIINILLLNLFNKKKEILILMKYKLEYKFNTNLILFYNMIFIFDKLMIKYKNYILILL